MTNPLLEPWDGPFGLPDFSRIEGAHFRPAFDAALAAREAEFDAIAGDTTPATFANTIEALERSGQLLDRVGAIFRHRAGADTNDEIQAIEREIAPRLGRQIARELTDERMFARIEAVVADPGPLTAEQARVLDLMHERARRAGAGLDAAARARMQAIAGRLAELGTAFSQNVLKDEASWVLELGEGDLDGLPESVVAAARKDAETRGRAGWLVTLARSSIEPFLTFSTRRDLREQAFRAWAARGEAANWPLVAETVQLRAERARLLGFPSFAHFKLDNQMARSPDRARALLMAVWEPARRRAAEDGRALQAIAAGEGTNISIEPWDWRHYAAKLRRLMLDLDESEIKPYLALDDVLTAAFDVAGRLFDLAFHPVDIPLPHPDARAWEVKRAGRHVGLFIGDYFARPSKRSGAWMSALRTQQRLWEPGSPVVLNTCNFARGDPPLLGPDEARTLFHEFGHALHGLMSDVTYPFVSGTSVARDFVELPSQLFEHWLTVPEILATHARHHRTGAPMPRRLIERLKAAETLDQSFSAVEFIASAIVDLDMHEIDDPADLDPETFEAEVLARIGMPPAIAMRHRTPHFQHVFAGDGYAAGYYSYMWAEVLDADAFRAFEESGDPFDRATAERLAGHILSVGGRERPEDAYRAFRGRLPGVEALLERRGLAATGAG